MYAQILTLIAVLIQTSERLSYTFQTENARESQGDHSETVGIEACWQDSPC